MCCRADEGQVLTAKELAALLGVGVQTVYEACQQNRIPHIKISPQNIRFFRPAIETWLMGKPSIQEEPLAARRNGQRASRAVMVY